MSICATSQLAASFLAGSHQAVNAYASAHAALPLSWMALQLMSWKSAALIFAGAAAVIVFLGVRSFNAVGPARKWTAITIRLLLVALLILLIGGLEVRRDNTDVEVIVLWDVSDSTHLAHDFPGAGKTSTAEALQKYLIKASQGSRKPDDTVGLIRFTDQALVESLGGPRLRLDSLSIVPMRSSTDIAGAIQLGLASFGKQSLHRLVLICDGNQTVPANIDAAIDAAAAQHVPIDVLPLTYRIENDISIDSVTTGKQWRTEKERFTLDVVVRSTNPAPVKGRISVFRDGSPFGDPIPVTIEPAQQNGSGELRPRTQVVHVPVPELNKSGAYEFSALFEPEALGEAVDSIPENNRATSFVMVHGKSRILVVSDAFSTNYDDVFTKALQDAGFEVDQVSTEAIPASPMRLQTYDAIVLRNVPRQPAAVDRALATYVHDGGGGLVMIGGPKGLGAGGWANSAVAQVMPVNFEVPAEIAIMPGALVFVLDHSGSMGGGLASGSASKQQIANESIVESLKALMPEDRIGVVEFDDGADWVLSLKALAEQSNPEQRIRSINPAGGTFIQSGLEAAYQGLRAIGSGSASSRHVILITDGQGDQPNALIADMVKDGISLSTIAVGDDADVAFLGNAAKLGKGIFYHVTDPKNLPQIFLNEAVTIHRALIQKADEGFPVQRELGTDPVAGIPLFKPIYGYVLTSPRNDPQVSMPLTIPRKSSNGDQRKDPLFAHWQTGLGRAAVFTSDEHADWAAPWLATPQARGDYNKFWTQTLRTVVRAPISTDVAPRITRDGGKAHITVEAAKDGKYLDFLTVVATISTPDGKAVTMTLSNIAPGLYGADFDADQPGNYIANIGYRGPDGANGWSVAGLTVNSSPELRDLSSNDSLLQQIAARTNGRIISGNDPAAVNLYSHDNLLASSAPRDVRTTLVWMLLVVLLIDVAARRIAWDLASIKRAAASVGARVSRWTASGGAGANAAAATTGALRRTIPPPLRSDVARRDAPRPPVAPPPVQRRPYTPSEARAADAANAPSILDNPPPRVARTSAEKAAADAANYTGDLLDAKRRAREKMQRQADSE